MRGPRVRPMVPGDLVAHSPVCAAHPGLDELLHDRDAPWARAAQDQWGLCGVMLLDDAEPVAELLVCAGLHLPVGHPLEQWSKLPQAAYLLALGVDDRAGDPAAAVRLLVQGVAKRLHGQVSTVEAVGRTSRASCLEPPLEWLAGAGFRELSEGGRDGCHRMRLELDQTIPWRGQLGRAREVLTSLVPRPVSPAEPTGREGGHLPRG